MHPRLGVGMSSHRPGGSHHTRGCPPASVLHAVRRLIVTGQRFFHDLAQIRILL